MSTQWFLETNLEIMSGATIILAATAVVTLIVLFIHLDH